MEKIYSSKDVANMWGCSLAMIKKLQYAGEIEVIKIGNKTCIKESEVQRYIDSNTIPRKII